MDGATGVGNGNGVEVVHQAPEGFVEGTAAGGAVAAEQFVAVARAGAPVMHLLWTGGGVEAFLHTFPQVVVIEVADGATDGAGGAAGEAVVGVSGDSGCGLSILDLDDSVPGVPDNGVTF